MDEPYKVIKFKEVEIGQEMEEAIGDQGMSKAPWVKIGDSEMSVDKDREVGKGTFHDPDSFCIVRIADCKSDFDTWFKESKEGQQLSHIDCGEEAARYGWNAAKGTSTPTTNE